MKTIVLNKKKEPFLDFLKGICIVWVILHHCLHNQVKDLTLFCFWGETAVPLFLILQSFHFFRKRNTIIISDYVSKMWKRVIRPFLFVEIVLFSINLFLYVLLLKETDFFSLVRLFLNRGGLGWGAYYPWIYVEFAFVLLIVNIAMENMPSRYYLMFFILISFLLEYICCIVDLNESFYRLLFFRYFFLILWGYRLYNDGIYMNKLDWALSLFSILCIIEFKYFKYDLSPFFYTKPMEWGVAHWVCYFYIGKLLIFLLYRLYLKVKEISIINSFFSHLGKYSYEVFLFQMCYYCFFPNYLFSSRIETVWGGVFYYVVSTMICISPSFICSYFHGNRSN